MTDNVELPPLPEPEVGQTESGLAIYNAFQMDAYARAALGRPPEAPAAGEVARLPDAFWEALQRLIENAVTQGPASMEDARLVRRYRDSLASLASTPVGEPAGRLTEVTKFDQRVINLQEKAFMPYAQALELAASEFSDVLCWVHEWGAIGLPLGHPSRVTCFKAFNTLAEAVEDATGCEFNDRILPVFQPSECGLIDYPSDRRTNIAASPAPAASSAHDFASQPSVEESLAALVADQQSRSAPAASKADDVGHVGEALSQGRIPWPFDAASKGAVVQWQYRLNNKFDLPWVNCTEREARELIEVHGRAYLTRALYEHPAPPSEPEAQKAVAPAGWKFVTGTAYGQRYVSVVEDKAAGKILINAYEQGFPLMFEFLSALASLEVQGPFECPNCSATEHLYVGVKDSREAFCTYCHHDWRLGEGRG